MATSGSLAARWAGSGLVGRARSLTRARPWPFHPLLVGAYFVLFLYSVNLEETELGDVLPVLAVVALLIAVVLMGLGLVLGDVRRVGLALTATLVALLAYEHVLVILTTYGVGPTIQRLTWAVVVGLAWVAAWQLRDWLAPLTRGLNVLAGVLVLVTLAVIAPHQFGLVTAVGSAPTTALDVDAPPTSGDTPDIVYLVWDRYPSERSLALAHGIENDLYDDLRARGFYVADRSHANYQRTSFSLASTLSAELHDRRGHAEELFGATDMSGPYSMIQNSNVARFLKTRGYHYVHIGSDFSGTRTSTLADVNPQYDNLSDFGAAFIESTALPGLARTLGMGGPRWERRYEWTRWELDQLENLPDSPHPMFVFAHVLLPHPPYIFEADGDFIPNPEASPRSMREQFRAQLAYTNRRLLGIVDRLLERPIESRPIVIVQADEGPYPAGLEGDTRHDWKTATPEEREIKFGILNAWYVPDGRDIGLYPEITSVNTFRLLFNEYFDTELPLLPDESFSRGSPEPLEFPP